ncbi:protein FAM234B isoform X1 [Mobula birostris]|uniref:protein FAM234B isoform X1 n=1 Tax=Mobula birostris TaxID=1983395 RepID=UPI003B27CF92
MERGASGTSAPDACARSERMMAAALSRALKLPGKKSHDLGEYDPLRQADSDDSADEGDVNYQKNGSLQTEATIEAVLNRDADTVVEMHSLKVKQCRSDQPSSVEVHATEVSDEFTTKTRASFLPCLRTSAFLLTLILTMVLVLVCAFFIPCPKRHALKTSWNKSLGQAAGFPPVITLWNVNNDQVSDVIISFSSTGKVRDQRGIFRPQASLKLQVSVAVLSGVDGSVLWTTPASERLKFIHCGIGYTDGKGAICILVGVNHMLKAVNSSSGSSFWERKSVYPSHRTPAAPPVQLPDIDGDGFGDVLLGSKPVTLTNRIHDVSFVFVSGATGALIGQPVTYNLTGEGKLIGPKACVSAEGALYILFGYGSIQAVSVRDIYKQANGKGSLPPSLWKEDSAVEWKREGNLSGVLQVYSGNSSVQDLQTLDGPEKNFSALLITTRNRLQILRGRHLQHLWQTVSSSIKGAPVAGFFNEDRVPDFLIQVTNGNNMKTSLIIDGSSGKELWQAELGCRSQGSEAASLPLSDGRSAFLFWAGECGADRSIQRTDPDRGNRYRLFLLHPSYPGVLLELATSSGPVTASATGIWKERKDAFHVAVTTDSNQVTHKSRMGPLLVTNVGLKEAIVHSKIRTLEEGVAVSTESIMKFFSELRFCTEVQRCTVLTSSFYRV